MSGDESDEMYGGAGDDLLLGGKGRDYLQGDEEDYPTPDAAAYNDRIFGGPGGDGIYLGNGDDEARGGSGNDTISHGTGMADLVAGVGDDDLETRMRFATGSVVDGGPGEDETYVWSVDVGDRRRLDVVGRIDLGSGRFVMRLGGRSHTSTLSGVERLRIPDGRWAVIGTGADETFYGGDLRRDSLMVRAGGGDDYVTATPGDDRLYGGKGRDKVLFVGRDDIVRGFEVVRG